MRTAAVIVASLTLLQGPPARASPDPAHKRLFYAADGVHSWELLTDDRNPDVYYRLPEGFGMVPAPGMFHAVVPQRATNGDLLLTLSWGPRDWASEDGPLRAAIRLTTGRDAYLATLYPQLLRLDLDPELAEDFGATLVPVGGEPLDLTPGSRWLAELRVPAAHEHPFVKRVVQGAGFSSLVRLSWRVVDPVLGSPDATYPYSVSFFVGGLDFCEVTPELACS
jgi:hypothetical protein